MTNSQLEEENELLRLQVQILQGTLREKQDEREAKRADAQLASLENEFLSNRSSWRSTAAAQDTQNMKVANENKGVNATNSLSKAEVHQMSHDASGILSGQTLDHAIKLSMQLAESRAIVDELQGQLQQALLKNALLERQLKETTAKTETLSCPQCDTSHHSRRSHVTRRSICAGSVRSWFGGSSRHLVLEAEKKPPVRCHSSESFATALTYVSAEDTIADTSSSSSTSQEVEKENCEDPTSAVAIKVQEL